LAIHKVLTSLRAHYSKTKGAVNRCRSEICRHNRVVLIIIQKLVTWWWRTKRSKDR